MTIRMNSLIALSTLILSLVIVGCGEKESNGDQEVESTNSIDVDRELPTGLAFKELKTLVDYARDPNDTGKFAAEQNHNFATDLGLIREFIHINGCYLIVQRFWRGYSSVNTPNYSYPTREQNVKVSVLHINLTQVDMNKTKLSAGTDGRFASEGQIVLQRGAAYNLQEFWFEGWTKLEDLDFYKNHLTYEINQALISKAKEGEKSDQRSGPFHLGYAYPEDQQEIQAAFSKLVSACQSPEVVAELEKEKEAKLQAFSKEQEAAREIASKFLRENGARPGVVTTASRLQYEIIREGTGPRPVKEDTVEVHYRGTLMDGTEFDSSYKRGVSVTFGVGKVIPGWTEALLLMPVGSKWNLTIPPELAYGVQGAGNVIPPNAALKFEVELLSIK